MRGDGALARAQVDLEENLVGDAVRSRLEHATEAVYILRPAADRAACAIQVLRATRVSLFFLFFWCCRSCKAAL